MNTVIGDLIKLSLEGKFDVIIHGVNCFCKMGKGIADQIKHTFPEAYTADCRTVKGDRSKLGTYSKAVVKIPNIDNASVAIAVNVPALNNYVYEGAYELIIINAYIQYNYGYQRNYTDYNALRNVFKLIKKDFSGKRIAYPKIGAGLAGGDWKIIKEIILEELNGEDHTYVKFEND